MRDNTGMLVAAAALLALTGMCCVGGAAAFFLVRSNTAAPPVAYPSYPPPSYPAPSYPPPTPYPYPPSGPAMPAPPPTGPLLVETSDTPVRGPVGAALTIHVVSDFQCPFCSRVEPTLAQIDAMYPGMIRWVWHDYPLPFHQDAEPAAEAAREVRDQLGDAAFWAYHDQLFRSQSGGLGRPTLEGIAATVPGIDMRRFRAALDSGQHAMAVRASIATVDASHGSTGTPSFLIGTTWIAGAQPFEAFRVEIDRQLGR